MLVHATSPSCTDRGKSLWVWRYRIARLRNRSTHRKSPPPLLQQRAHVARATAVGNGLTTFCVWSIYGLMTCVVFQQSKRVSPSRNLILHLVRYPLPMISLHHLLLLPHFRHCLLNNSVHAFGDVCQTESQHTQEVSSFIMTCVVFQQSKRVVSSYTWGWAPHHLPPPLPPPLPPDTVFSKCLWR